MKYLNNLPILVLIATVLGCAPLNQTSRSSAYVKPYKQVLYQSYSGKSSENNNSAFGVRNRNIEFEYTLMDSMAVAVKIMMSSGFNEGSVVPKLQAVFTDGQILDLEIVPVETIHYSQTYNITSSESVVNTQHITEPSRTEEIQKSDGTKETINIPSTTKTVQTSQNIPVNQTTVDNKIFNQLEVMIKAEQLQKFQKVPMDHYIAYFKKGSIKINVGSQARLNLINHLVQKTKN